jgi:murein DD-endopeptidase MepM/ murein hydrolase activator NlpD
MSRAWGWAAGAALLLFSPCLLGIGAFASFGTDSGGVCAIPVTTGSAAPASASSGYGNWTAGQVGNATTIVEVGVRMQVPRYGWVIAVATAMQESGLSNLGDLGHENDHDSLGLFQQRRSQGWGTAAQIMQPEYAATQFYQHLLKVKNWQVMSLTAAGQAVQRSAFPSAYAKWQPEAESLVTAVSGTTGTVDGCGADISTSGWTNPLPGATVGSGFRTSDRPTHDGVDLIAERGTPILAAAAGTVIHVECDRSELGYHCDHDGGSGDWPGGCGWYVDIQHAGGVITRYCHQQTRPLVKEGDKVTAGQQIGVVGSTGHSSGPHLHFEVHLGSRASDTATDPITFLAQVGVVLTRASAATGRTT